MTRAIKRNVSASTCHPHNPKVKNLQETKHALELYNGFLPLKGMLTIIRYSNWSKSLMNHFCELDYYLFLALNGLVPNLISLD